MRASEHAARNAPEVEEAFQRGFTHGVNHLQPKLARARAHATRAERQLAELHGRYKGEVGSLRHILARVKSTLTPAQWEEVFGPRKKGQP